MKDHFAGLGLAAAAASGRVTSGLEGFPGGHPLLSHMQVNLCIRSLMRETLRLVLV
jgi:hypothetical protein